MAQNRLEQFRHIILQDAKIQDQLKGAADQASFLKLMTQIAEKLGFNFTAEEILSALTVDQSAGVRELSDRELAAVAGARPNDNVGDLWTTLFGPC